jgi:predicted nucleic acid-binding protein
MPPPHRLAPVVVSGLLERWFPARRTISPSRRISLGIVKRCSESGIDGGAVYDALVGLTAAEAGHPLITRDVRAARTYRRLGIDVEVMR